MPLENNIYLTKLVKYEWDAWEFWNADLKHGNKFDFLRFNLFHNFVLASGWESEYCLYKLLHLQATFDPGLPQQQKFPLVYLS